MPSIICNRAWVFACGFALSLALMMAVAAPVRADAGSGPPARAPQFARTISEMAQLVRQPHKPFACISDLDGELAMTATAQVCICDAKNKQWKTVGTGAACVW